MTAALHISVCICTKDRPRAIERLLHSIPIESEHVYEIIVSDDGSGEAPHHLLEQFKELRWMIGPRRGVGANRNCVTQSARGNHVWFLDDDAVASRACLDQFVRCLQEAGDHQDRTILSGSVVEAGQRIEPHEQSFLGFQARVYRSGDRRTTVVLPNALFPRSLFDRIQFDETLTSVYEEVDFTTRAVALGYTIVDCPGAEALHEPVHGTRHDRYGDEIDVARIYVTAKRRLFTEGAPVRAIAYLIVASTHLAASRVKHGGLRTLPHSMTLIRAVIARLRRVPGHMRSQTRQAF